MVKHDVDVHDIVQVNPDYEIFGGCMVVVTELKTLGIQGYVQSAGVPQRVPTVRADCE